MKLPPLLCVVCLCLLSSCCQAASPFAEFVDPHPNAGNQFGATVVALSTGNVVITAPNDDAGGSNAGAVYLFNGTTGALISTLTGSTANDQVGSGGVAVLSNGNYVVRSPFWDNTGVVDAGAATWGSGTTGVSGVVSSSNSLVGTTANDQVGSGGVTALSNGNYVVLSTGWDNAGVVDAGALSWGSGATGASGVVNSSNSLVGTTANDQVGSDGVTALSNGNYVVLSTGWDNAGVVDAGATTWGSGTTGVSGVVSSGNSLVGSTAGDQVGYGGVTVLTNGCYVVSSPGWDNATVVDAGAATWGSGTTGVSGVVSSSNSLVGSSDNDYVSTYLVTALSNGNYVVSSKYWDNAGEVDAGAATWGSGTTGVSGVVSSSNSLVGSSDYDFVGTLVTALGNGNYVVSTPSWHNAGVIDAGAAAWGNGSTGISGLVSSSNSLVGSSAGDRVSYGGVTVLSNDNYVVNSPLWDNAGVSGAGAVTWGSGTTGISGVVSSSNSLVGSTASDQVGWGAVTALSNGNYVVSTWDWDNGGVTDAGAATWGNGTTGVSGAVSSSNSLVGSTVGDRISFHVTALSNGNYVVRSQFWDNAGVIDAGAVTWGSGTTGVSGVVSSSNSLVGSTASDNVGSQGVTALSNGNYVVRSQFWDNAGVVDAGTVTWGSGSSGVSGVVSSGNSLVGSTAGDQVGSQGVTVLSNGNYVVRSQFWDDAGVVNAGAATWGSGSSGVSGVVSSGNSLVGAKAGDQVGSGGVTVLSNGHYVVRSVSWDNASMADAGAVTWGSGSSGISGAVSGSNSLVGLASSTNLQAVVVDDVNGTFCGRFVAEGSGKVRLASQADGQAAVSAPSVVSIAPASGSTLGGTSVTITGTGFSGATGATVGGVALTSFSVSSATTATGTTGAHAAGLVDVAITGSPNGASTGGTGIFTYVTPPPSVTLSTTNIPTTATTLTITGTNFDDITPGNNTVVFTPAGTTGTVTSSTSTQLIVSITGLTVGSLSAVVTTNGQNSGAPVQVASISLTVAGDLDPLDANLVGSYVLATAVQPDKKIIIGGKFTSVLGVPRSHIARLNEDGTLDTGFDPKANDEVSCVAVQADGKVLLGGDFSTLQPNGASSATARAHIARVNADGSLDTGFDPKAGNTVTSVTVQADGKVLLGGFFSALQPNGAPSPTVRNRIARVNEDGTLDTGFDPNASNVVYSIALQADGKVLLGGGFTTLQPNGATSATARQFIARVNADGTLDTGFDPKPNNVLYAVALQADGKVLIGGNFSTLQPNGAPSPTVRDRVARVNADGTLDTGFDPKANLVVYSMAVQADGKVLLGGAFTSLQPNGAASPTVRHRIARVNADGTLDAGFDPKADSFVYSVALQADGRVLLGGQFTTLQPNGAGSPTARNLFARLLNAPAPQTLSMPSAAQIDWTRSGAGPELSLVTFELSTNGGTSWNPLGSGTRVGITPDWQLTGLSLPVAGSIRARGRTTNGYFNGGGGLIEQVLSFGVIPSPTVTMSTASLLSTATTLIINGTNFSATPGDNTVVFTPSGTTGTVTASTSTQLTVNVSGLSSGALSAVVTSNGQNSGAPVQVAAVVPVVISSTVNLAVSATTLTISGHGFSPTPGNNTVAFTPSGSGTVTAATATSLTVTSLTGLTLGALNAVVTANGQNSGAPVQVAVVVPVPEIALTGNGVDIPHGDTSPGTADDTYFGNVALFNAQETHTFTITNEGSLDLHVTTVLITPSGSSAGAFAVTLPPTSPVAASDSTSFDITFDPTLPGSQTATVTIFSDAASHPAFTFTIRGYGTLDMTLPQAITFAPPAVVYLNQSPLSLSAQASSGLPVTLSVLPAGTTAAGASIVGNALSFTGTGIVKVQAAQAGGGLYAAAPTVVKTIAVKVNPTQLTMLDFVHLYTGTPRVISTLGGAGPVTIEYKIGADFGSTAPKDVGRYPVRATDSKGTKTGTLVISKAPLYVTPVDQRKFVGQDNPALTLNYSGFVNGETDSVVTTAPSLKTTATSKSLGGVYPITVSGGSSANYTFIYQKGVMVVESFAANYEALLTNDGGGLVGKLVVTIAAANTSFTGKLYCVDEKTALPLRGSLVSNPGSESATGSATVTSGGIPYEVNFTTRITGSLSADVTRGGGPYASTSTGRRVLASAAGQSVLYAGAHTVVLEPAIVAAAGVPAGAGWAAAVISTKGVMTLAGRLGDGTSFTTTLMPDDASDPTYRLFLQPYKTGAATRLQSHFGGSFTLTPHPALAGRRHVEAAVMTWVKLGLPTDESYRSGFGVMNPVSSVLMLDPWLPPAAAKRGAPAIPLASRLGLTSSSFEVLHANTGSTLNDNLPTRAGLSSTNAVTVTAPAANTTKWKATLVPATGLFSGSFELADTTPKPRVVTFSGVLRQPTTPPDALIGDGHYLLPPLAGTEKTTGEIMFLRP